MSSRFLCIWFRYLKTDWVSKRRPELRLRPFVLSQPDHGRMIVTAVNPLAAEAGIKENMVVADARALCPDVEVLDDAPSLEKKLLKSLALWSIRFTPVAAIDLPDGIMLDITGCAHLWGGEEGYISTIARRLEQLGYVVRLSIADTIGAAWAAARYSKQQVVPAGEQAAFISCLPPACLRIAPEMAGRLERLGLKQVEQLLSIPAKLLQRRFGEELILRIGQALGHATEKLEPVIPRLPYQERLPCLEPVFTLSGIRYALEQLLQRLCARLKREGRGARKLLFSCYRVDRQQQQLSIGTHRASQRSGHLLRLFEDRLPAIDPGCGIELFTLDAMQVEELAPLQQQLWQKKFGPDNIALTELIDRIETKTGANTVHRFLPAQHYWPERSFMISSCLNEEREASWPGEWRRPLQLLQVPEPVQVAAPVPDYPPMLFRHKGVVHVIKKADGPERIEQEWWIQKGEHRDYYIVEDEEGNRYWLFRLGHYDPSKNNQWFLHGYFP